MPSPLLCEIDDLLRLDHPQLQPDDRCLFLREYLAGVGFQGGETNSLSLEPQEVPRSSRTTRVALQGEGDRARRR